MEDESGAVYRATTNAFGGYNLPLLPGSYTLTFCKGAEFDTVVRNVTVESLKTHYQQDVRLNDFAYGFMQGVQASNEADGTTIRAYNSYIGDFTNSPKGSRLASDFYESGVEVLFAAASQAGLGCIDSAKANGRLIIGVDSDQYAYYQQSDPEKAACIVTSVLKRVDLALYDCCERFMAGTLTYGDLDVLGIADGMIGLVENENYTTLVPQQIRDDITDAARQIAAGELSVASGLKRYTAQYTLNALFDKLDPTK